MPIRTTEYDAPTLRRLRAYLAQFVNTIDEAISFVDETEEPLWVFKGHSQEEGMRRLGSFHDELMDSLIAAQSGRPYTADTLKPRATPKATPPKIPGMQRASDMSVPDETASEQDIDRAAKRSVTKKKATQPAKGGRKKKSG